MLHKHTARAQTHSNLVCVCFPLVGKISRGEVVVLTHLLAFREDVVVLKFCRETAEGLEGLEHSVARDCLLAAGTMHEGCQFPARCIHNKCPRHLAPWHIAHCTAAARAYSCPRELPHVYVLTLMDMSHNDRNALRVLSPTDYIA